MPPLGAHTVSPVRPPAQFILAFYGFGFPIALTAWHQIFCTSMMWGASSIGVSGAEKVDISWEDYVKRIVPIGAMFAGVLWLGNAAYLYLSVSFIQMVKAFMPVLVYFVGLGFGLERFRVTKLGILVMIVTGVAIASYGEVHFVVHGFLLLCASLVLESLRVCSLQVLLQRAGLKLNPFQTLMYIAPVTGGFLLPFAVLLEGGKIVRTGPPLTLSFALVMITNASIALALNVTVFKVIKGQSALSLNVAGVIKDWLLIVLSYVLYHSPVTSTQVFGYGLAFVGVFVYNMIKNQDRKREAASQAAGGSK